MQRYNRLVTFYLDPVIRVNVIQSRVVDAERSEHLFVHIVSNCQKTPMLGIELS